MASAGENVYSRIGARPVINAAGNTTVWGGSTPSSTVQQAMDQANASFVEMEELLKKSGDYIANCLGVEGAYVASGCYAALALSTAACMTGSDPELSARLPDTEGMKNEVVLAKPQEYTYDRSYTVSGAKLVWAGDDEGASLEAFEQAIGPNTAAVAYLVRGEPDSNVASLAEVVELARSQGVPVIADAAAQIYPTDYFVRNAQAADLVCFGGKYMGGPQSSGFVCGRGDLIDAVTHHGFISHKSVGRGMKLDRQEILGLVAALDEWFTMDHEERLIGYGARFTAIEDGLRGVSAIKSIDTVSTTSYWGVGLTVSLDTGTLGKSAPDVAAGLLAGSPRVRMDAVDDNTLRVCVHNLSEGDEHIVAEQLRSALT